MATILLFTACGKTTSSQETVAKVNGSPIPLSAFENQANRFAHMPGKDLSSATERKNLLGELIQQEVLYQAALKEHLIEKSERLKREVAREYLSEKIGKERYEPSEDEIKSFYEAKKNEMEKVRVSHILIKPKNSNDPKSWDEAKTKAEGILKKIRMEGAKADFAKYAKQFSQDMANKDQGGDLMYFERARMVPEFSNIAFSLKKIGDVSDVVKTSFGYHIIKLTGEQRGLETFRTSVKWQMAQEKRKQKADKLLKELQDNASVQIYDDVLAKAQIAKAPEVMPLPAAPKKP